SLVSLCLLLFSLQPYHFPSFPTRRASDLTAPVPAFHLYDTTLRDGSQQEGLSLSVADKLAVARHLDDLGVTYIEIVQVAGDGELDRKSTRLNSSHVSSSYAVFCYLKK